MIERRLDHNSVRALIADLKRYDHRWFCFFHGCLETDPPWQIIRAEPDHEDSYGLNLTVRYSDGSVVDHRFTMTGTCGPHNPYNYKSAGLYKRDEVHEDMMGVSVRPCAGFLAVAYETYVPVAYETYVPPVLPQDDTPPLPEIETILDHGSVPALVADLQKYDQRRFCFVQAPGDEVLTAQSASIRSAHWEFVRVWGSGGSGAPEQHDEVTIVLNDGSERTRHCSISPRHGLYESDGLSRRRQLGFVAVLKDNAEDKTDGLNKAALKQSHASAEVLAIALKRHLRDDPSTRFRFVSVSVWGTPNRSGARVWRAVGWVSGQTGQRWRLSDVSTAGSSISIHLTLEDGQMCCLKMHIVDKQLKLILPAIAPPTALVLLPDWIYGNSYQVQIDGRETRDGDRFCINCQKAISKVEIWKSDLCPACIKIADTEPLAPASEEPADVTLSAIDHSSAAALVRALKEHHVGGRQYWPGPVEAPRFQFIDEYGRRGLPWHLLSSDPFEDGTVRLTVSDDRTTVSLVMELSNGTLRLDPAIHPEPGGLVRHLFSTAGVSPTTQNEARRSRSAATGVGAGHRIVFWEPEEAGSTREPIEELADAVSEHRAAKCGNTCAVCDLLLWEETGKLCRRCEAKNNTPPDKKPVRNTTPLATSGSAYVDGHDGATLHTKPLNGKPVKKPWPRWVGILALLAAMTVAYHADRIIEVSVQQMQEVRTKVQAAAYKYPPFGPPLGRWR